MTSLPLLGIAAVVLGVSASLAAHAEAGGQGRCQRSSFGSVSIVAAILALCLAGRPEAIQLFKASTSVVPVYVTVTDSQGNLVDTLVQSDFEIQDNGKRQVISVFKSDVQPITIALLLDRSPSLFPIYDRARDAVVELIGRLTPDDRACVGTFSQSVTLDPKLTRDHGDLIKQLEVPGPWPAGTAMWDALHAGSVAIGGEGGRRVVLIVTDGADNSSRADPNGVRAKLQRDGVIVYAIAIRGRFGFDFGELSSIANATGGRAIELKAAEEIPSAMKRVIDELHHQYVIGFSPQQLDNKLHRLTVKVRRPHLTVRAARAYFAAKVGQ